MTTYCKCGCGVGIEQANGMGRPRIWATSSCRSRFKRNESLATTDLMAEIRGTLLRMEERLEGIDASVQAIRWSVLGGSSE